MSILNGFSEIQGGLFLAIGEFNDFATAFYFSVVNFTTLGYGDIVMSEQNRLLGVFEAGNGFLMLGLTTSVLFLVLGTAVQRVWDERFKHEKAGMPSDPASVDRKNQQTT